MRSIFVFVLLFSSLTASAQNTPTQSIFAVLDEQVRAWNRGDVVSFMNGYLDSDSTRFVSAKGVTEGYQRVLARYLSAYPTKEKMGELSFSDLKINLLSSDIAIVVGQWQLRRSNENGGNVGGYFTLIFQKTANGWKIIHDHTS
ncbi:MAG: nuclear transport factor 2 family protein [Chloroherpetonaceae bacterium]